MKGLKVTVSALLATNSDIHVKSARTTKVKNVEENCQRFGQRLFSAMEKCNVSQSDLARFMNVSRSAASFWVKGQTYPSIDNVEKIADYLRTTPEYLLFGVVHVSEERLVESIPVITRIEGSPVEITRLTLPREFMARAHLSSSKFLKAISIFSDEGDSIAIADTSDRVVNTKESKMMVIDHDGKIDCGNVIKKKGDAGTIFFEHSGHTIEMPFEDKMVVGRLAALVTATQQHAG